MQRSHCFRVESIHKTEKMLLKCISMIIGDISVIGMRCKLFNYTICTNSRCECILPLSKRTAAVWIEFQCDVSSSLHIALKQNRSRRVCESNNQYVNVGSPAI